MAGWIGKDSADQNIFHGHFNKAVLRIGRFTGEGLPRRNRFRVPRQDGDTVPGALPFPCGLISDFVAWLGWECGAGRFDFRSAGAC
jgi:hypothetical protein